MTFNLIHSQKSPEGESAAIKNNEELRSFSARNRAQRVGNPAKFAKVTDAKSLLEILLIAIHHRDKQSGIFSMKNATEYTQASLETCFLSVVTRSEHRLKTAWILGFLTNTVPKT